jgi:hypothetical protein
VFVQWGKNYGIMHDRVLMHPERVQNLYFTFLFVLRAVTKVCNFSVPSICVALVGLSSTTHA